MGYGCMNGEDVWIYYLVNIIDKNCCDMKEYELKYNFYIYFILFM